MKYYEIQRRKRTHPFGVAVLRVCNCTHGNGPDHEWRETCDRYPPKVMRHCDGTLEDIAMLRNTFRVVRTKQVEHEGWAYHSVKKIPERRYRYLTDLQLWAMQHNPRHPIANTFRKMGAKRREFLTNDYR